MKIKIIFFYFLLVVIVMTSACTGETRYFNFNDVTDVGWNKSDTLCYSLSMQESGKYNEDIIIKKTDIYPFRSVTIIVDCHYYPGTEIKSDTLTCSFDEGRTKKVNSGMHYTQHRYSLPEMYLKRGDSLRVFVRHDMKRETLEGIISVGLKIDKK